MITAYAVQVLTLNALIDLKETQSSTKLINIYTAYGNYLYNTQILTNYTCVVADLKKNGHYLHIYCFCKYFAEQLFYCRDTLTQLVHQTVMFDGDDVTDYFPLYNEYVACKEEEIYVFITHLFVVYKHLFLALLHILHKYYMHYNED